MRRRLITSCIALAGSRVLPAAVPSPAPADAKRGQGQVHARPSRGHADARSSVGATLTIRGRNFSSRRTRNTVIFRVAARALRVRQAARAPAARSWW